MMKNPGMVSGFFMHSRLPGLLCSPGNLMPYTNILYAYKASPYPGKATAHETQGFQPTNQNQYS
jgi:hypothetical protein